jgi:hypothetical protein
MRKRTAVLLAVAFAFALSPAGWTWGGKNDANAGWSWNADIASVNGNTVTLMSKRGDTLTLTPVTAADPVPGGDVIVVQSGLIWSADNGGTVEQPLGWTWNG